MNLGRIVEMGDTEALFARPAHSCTRAQFSAIPVAAPDAPRRRGLAVLAGAPAVLLTVGLLAAAPESSRRSQSPAPPPVADAGTLLEQLRHYLTGYESQLGEVVAVERMTQRAGVMQFGDPNATSRNLPRTLESDVAFVGLPGGAGWLGYRDVLRVNGRPTRRAGPSLSALLSLQNGDATDRARALLFAGAVHNLGAPRTINLPSLPLEFLHPRNAGRLTLSASQPADTTRGACRGRQLDLVETLRPTLIQRPLGGDMPSRVSAWVEPESGRLCRAEVRTRDASAGDGGFEAVVAVDFSHDAAVDLTVPTRMREEFFVAPLGRGTSEATYGSYRRFRTSARMLPPGARLPGPRSRPPCGRPSRPCRRGSGSGDRRGRPRPPHASRARWCSRPRGDGRTAT